MLTLLHDVQRAADSKPLRADAARNRRRVLDAATRVFAEQGPTATLNDVAGAAGVGVGTIYRAFHDKEALLDALLDDKLDTVMEVVRSATSMLEPGLAFRSYLFGMIAVHAADRSLATVLFAPDRRGRFPNEVARELEESADRLIEAAILAGELRDGFTRQDTTVLAVMVGGIATVTRDQDSALWRRYAQIVVDGTSPSAHPDALSPDPLSFPATTDALGRSL
jgi:AcrR family transcriptional regulator